MKYTTGLVRPTSGATDIHNIHAMKLLGILELAMGLVALLATWAAADPAYPYDPWRLGLFCLLISLGMVGLFFVHAMPWIYFATVSILALLTEAFYQLASASPAGPLWSLVVGIIFALVMAPVFIKVVHYLGALAMTALLLGRGDWIALAPQHDMGWNYLMPVLVAIMGVLLNVVFARLRREGSHQRIALEKMAYQDALTGLDNRRSVMQRLRALQDDGDLHRACFLMVDVDNFKQINDSFGHDHGDTVLQVLAAAMRDQAAPHMAVRMGGEEFGVLMETGDGAAAIALGNRLLEAARRLSRHPGRAAPTDQTRLGISVGVACGRPEDAAGDLLRRADDALYAAKRAGKDRCSTDSDRWPDPRPEPGAAAPGLPP